MLWKSDESFNDPSTMTTTGEMQMAIHPIRKRYRRASPPDSAMRGMRDAVTVQFPRSPRRARRMYTSDSTATMISIVKEVALAIPMSEFEIPSL